MSLEAKLESLRSRVGSKETLGLSLEELSPFAAQGGLLDLALSTAKKTHDQIFKSQPALLGLAESSLIKELQKGYLNFYAKDAINPYIPIAAKGPWVITSHGAVIHDSGGYGMLGLGHDPDGVKAALSEPAVMANIMSASFAQGLFYEALKTEIGHRRSAQTEPVYAKFLCLNSGSEAMTMALKLSDMNAKKLLAPGAPKAGYKAKFLALKGSFHGRTDRPSQASDSTQKTARHLASYNPEQLITVAPNDLAALKSVFEQTKKERVFIEAMLLEPVMGEGNPGLAMTPEFYALARELSAEEGSYLIVDSIQAGLRARGVLSIVDYPGFEHLAPPDAESFSKAINAGQFPLSVLGLRAPVAATYLTGIYGNTMTANPRALMIASAVMQAMTPDLRLNIRTRGEELLRVFAELKQRFPAVILGIQGTGLLLSMELIHKGYRVVGPGAIEETLRKRGLGIIHGGHNALRLTPHFAINSEEIKLIGKLIGEVLEKGPQFGDA